MEPTLAKLRALFLPIIKAPSGHPEGAFWTPSDQVPQSKPLELIRAMITPKYRIANNRKSRDTAMPI
mgnify:CR=1 FL=1